MLNNYNPKTTISQKRIIQSNEITTLKLHKETKQRLEKLREHKRETYEDIIKKILSILNLVRGDPDKAKFILERIDYNRSGLLEGKESSL